MPVHDWSKVEAGVFHAFHLHWLATLSNALNQGILPRDYYALPDQVAGPGHPDVIGLERVTPRPDRPGGNGSGGPVVAEPRARFQETADRMPTLRKQRHVRIRHVTGDRVVAVIEVVSPSNKHGRAAVKDFAGKLTAYLAAGIHVLVIDLHKPGPADPGGLHPLIWKAFRRKSALELPTEKPLTVASYAAGEPIRTFVEPVAVDDPLPDMPLFLTTDRHVSVPLESTYGTAWLSMPERWREVLDPPPA